MTPLTDIQRKLRVLQHAEKIGNARKASRYFGIGRSSFYRWRDAYQKVSARRQKQRGPASWCARSDRAHGPGHFILERTLVGHGPIHHIGERGGPEGKQQDRSQDQQNRDG